MATITTESWTGTTGAAWPAQWTTAVAGTGVVSIDANRGRLFNAASSTAAGNKAYLTGMSAVRDMDFTVTVMFATLGGGFLSLYARAPDSTSASTDPTNGYFVGIDPSSGGNGAGAAWVGKYVNGVYSDVLPATTLNATPWVANTQYSIRFQTIANTLGLKIWQASGSEPAGWTWTGTDTSGSAWTGRMWIGQRPWATDTWNTYLSNLTITDNGTVTPVGPTFRQRPQNSAARMRASVW